MAGWDDDRVVTQNLGLTLPSQDEPDLSLGDSQQAKTHIQAKFRQFLKEFQSKRVFVYREQLIHNYEQGDYRVTVNWKDVARFEEDLASLLKTRPGEYLPVFEAAAKEVVASTIIPKPREADMHHIHVQLRDIDSTTIRDLNSSHVGKLVGVRGIVVSASRVNTRATELAIVCKNCKSQNWVKCGHGFGAPNIPRVCDNLRTNEARQAADQKCPLDPWVIIPDRSTFTNSQRLKLQENPEMVPTGEVPRHVDLCVENMLVGTCKPGSRVTVVGIFSIYQAKGRGGKARIGNDNNAVAIRNPYLRVLHIDSEDPSESSIHNFTEEEMTDITEISKMPDLFDKISKSIAPSIMGHEDIKKAIAAQLFGGARKHLPDGMRIRGDINVLLLGDPSLGKSQFLKYAKEVAPVCVYTSGKGSSAAGLTASVIRDPSSGGFNLEGGALVLADGGIVCIDEFDKMREEDRIAIHEAMEQQTISIAKAGITTILNSRTSVLAAANPIFGRYDDMKSPVENIDFQMTILSRFDLIFVLRDTIRAEHDQNLAKHIISVHQGKAADARAMANVIDAERLKTYIAYSRAHCDPRLSESAVKMLKEEYVAIRSTIRKRRNAKKEEKDWTPEAIPITVRQLEAIVRLSEALARLELQPVANEEHVRRAIRLFKVSTFQAATLGYMEGKKGSGSFHQEVMKVEKQLQARVAIGTQKSVKAILGEFVHRQEYREDTVRRAVQNMVQRGEFIYQQRQHQVKRLK
ncbi:hypothetical protein AAMO2058_000968100 [Amorphochlora amoebiformis]